jgi:hypothetical protein
MVTIRTRFGKRQAGVFRLWLLEKQIEKILGLRASRFAMQPPSHLE